MKRESCSKIREMLPAYLEGAAASEVEALVAGHLERCTDCRILADTLRKTIALYLDLPQPELPAEVRARLYEALGLTDFSTPGRESP